MKGVLAGKLALLGVGVVAVAAASAAPTVDFYIRGTVLGRVPGKNVANVEIRWDYKCLGDRLGEATYNWTLRIVRKLPRPERTRTLTTGTSKTGSTRVQLTPGRWEPLADPFRCETERGGGSTQAELGLAFVVPDYCAWSAVSLRGSAGVEQGQAVKALGRGDAVRPGDVVFTRGGGSVALQTRGGGSSARLGAGTRLRIDPRHCGRTGGWKLVLVSGTVQTRLGEPDRRRPYRLETQNAVTTASRATWKTEARVRNGRPWTRVRVQSGRVSVRGGGRTSVVSAGRARIIQ